MTVDLSKLKIGDQVKFRNGEIDIVLGIKYNVSELYSYLVFLNNKECVTSYIKNGHYLINCEDSNDIVEIIPKNENWGGNYNLIKSITEIVTDGQYNSNEQVTLIKYLLKESGKLK